MARLAAAVLACGLFFAGAVREDAARLQQEDSDMSQDQLLKMIRDLQGRVSALEGQRGSESKSSRCCSKTTNDGKMVGYCLMSDGEAGCLSTNTESSTRATVSDEFCPPATEAC
mmetsp:Transcript_130395/g.309395  ORF Transcript_130395/g.309395 Transcript_130395/m.309395 type:complete len:114 (+) Transcript_130395:48-389(+)